MRHFLGLLLRLVLAFSLVSLPWTQSWAMAVAQEVPAMPCHSGDQGDQPGKPASENKAGGCYGKVQCHCISAIALPCAQVQDRHRAALHWEAWTPAHPHNHVFAPTPPPPRA